MQHTMLKFGAGRAQARESLAHKDLRNSSLVIGVLNMPNVPVVDAFWPSGVVVAQQSVSVTVLKPFSYAVRIVDSTQQFVRKPPSTTVSMPCCSRRLERLVPGKASSPCLPCTTRSPSGGPRGDHPSP